MADLSSPTVSVRSLSGAEARAMSPALATLLIDCVEGGASVSFMLPLSRETAEGFWAKIAEDVSAGARILLVAEEVKTKAVVGTVQVILSQPENQPHRGDVCKILVAPSARRRGIGAGLMRAAESAARAAGKTLLVLDTANDEAKRLYERMGWVKAGVIPDYALWPEGGLCDTTYYYRRV